MRITIIGGTGFIGREIARLASERGDEVTLFNRGASDPASTFPTIRGDVAAIGDHAIELRALEPDVVIHCIAYDERDARNITDVYRGTGAHIVVLGSQDCYAAFIQFRAGQDVSDFPVTEESQLAAPHYWRGTGHSNAETYDKNALTAALLELDPRATVLRLPMVYGPGDPQFPSRHGDIIHHLLDDRTEFVIGYGEQGTLWTYGYITNVAAAVLHAALRGDVRGTIFNIGEQSVRTRRRWADLYARAAGRTFQYRVVPDELLDPSHTRNVPQFHIVVDNSAFVRVTGFTDPVTLPDAIDTTLEWARRHPDRIGEAPDFDARSRAADRHEAALRT